MISVEIMKTTDEKKNAKNNKTKANKDRKDQWKQKL